MLVASLIVVLEVAENNLILIRKRLWKCVAPLVDKIEFI